MAPFNCFSPHTAPAHKTTGLDYRSQTSPWSTFDVINPCMERGLMTIRQHWRAFSIGSSPTMRSSEASVYSDNV